MYCLNRVVACISLAALLPWLLPAQAKKSSAEKTPYFDEPTFIVAGVSDNTNRGGHGSDVLLQSTEALAKATASLGSSTPAAIGEEIVREQIAKEPNNATLHHLLAALLEKRGNFVEALREHQRTVELNANETNIFDLGDELLTHHAPEQAAEVFKSGVEVFPSSSRILLGLAVALYSAGSYDQASRAFFAACDLDPIDPTPYLFLGKVHATEITASEGFGARIERFTKLHPENAWANYYYAISLKNGPAQKEVLLQKSVRLDPKLAPAWVELGIFYTDRNEQGKAIAALQNAITVNPQMETAHYRLAQAYRRIGEEEKAKQELKLFEQLSKQSAEKLNHERSETKRFVFDPR